MGRIGKNVIYKISLFYSNVSQFGPNHPIDHGDTNLGEKYVPFYMMPIYSKTLANIKISSLTK